MHLARSIATVLGSMLLAVTLRAQGDYSTAESQYLSVVKDKIDAPAWTEADTAAARAAASGLAATGKLDALTLLSRDAGVVGDKLYSQSVEVEGRKREIEQQKGKLADLTGDDRARAEQRIAELEKQNVDATARLPGLQALREVLFEGVLAVTDRIADSNPEVAFDALADKFREDTKAFFDAEQKVRELQARLADAEEKLGAAPKAEQDKFDKQVAELAAAIAVQEPNVARIGQQKARRILALAKVFPALQKPRQAKEVAELKKQLKDDVAWETRAVSVELLGHLPADGVAAEALGALKRAAKSKLAFEKLLGPMREAYDKALEALMSSLRGSSNGTVPSATLANEQQRRGELRATSAKSYGEGRVMEAAANALADAVANLAGAERAAALDELVKSAHKETDRDVRTRLVDAMARLADPKVAEDLRATAAKDPDVRLRLAAIDALARLKDGPAVELCRNSLLKDTDWRVRSAAMKLLAAVPDKGSVPALIEALGAEVGRLIDDAEAALETLTAESFNGDAQLWRDWWSKNKDTFEVAGGPAAAGAPGAVAKRAWKDAPGKVSFYGIATRSGRILYVIDRSGSMLEPIGEGKTGPGAQTKFEAAKAQLLGSLRGLKDGDVFNVISYSSDVSRWQKTMTTSNEKVRDKAAKYVERELQAQGGTNIYDALMDAFRVAGIGTADKAYQSNVDTIFFLTDGKPSVGEVQDPAEILKRVKEWNRLARVVVHTVGVGKDHDAAFLRQLAEDNGGQYVSR